jgi:hypothetical protein
VRQDGILRDIDLGAIEALETKSTDVEQPHLEQFIFLSGFKHGLLWGLVEVSEGFKLYVEFGNC